VLTQSNLIGKQQKTDEGKLRVSTLITFILDLSDFLCRLRHTYLRKNNDSLLLRQLSAVGRVLLINNNFHGQHAYVLVGTCEENNVWQSRLIL
jgi:hypothetical protein